MKAVFLFTSGSGNENYAHLAYKIIFPAMLRSISNSVSSLACIGDVLPEWRPLLLHYVENDLKKHNNDLWNRFRADTRHLFNRSMTFSMCFDSISQELCAEMNRELENHSNYIGTMEIDDRIDVLYGSFSGSLVPAFKIFSRKMRILMPDEEGIDNYFADFLLSLGFEDVKYEFTGLQYTVFDEAHSLKNAKNTAAWRFMANNLLLGVTDSIVARLIDAAPDLGEKLFAAFDTFQRAQTSEHLSQVMVSCRRIFEYVTDAVFPAAVKNHQGNKLGKQQYKNRLYQFAEDSRKSDTQIGSIVANTAVLFEQWEKLLNLANKGVHNEVSREETKRCMIRTILLLDDIISLKSTPFESKVKLNADFSKMIKKFLP